ncbi:MAG: SusC/RagA family TonB-linked outer membrane protein [Bacteroidales bacterium]|nr:SusC/RagA family TonB-linked outer membrane protein [Bacteroidales bacterium]
MKKTLLTIIITLLSINFGLMAQNKITLSVKESSLKDVLWSIEKQSKFTFMYSSQDLVSAGNISVNINAGSVEEAIIEILKGTGLTYTIQDNVIVIKAAQQVPQKITSNNRVEIKGRVTDTKGEPLAGASMRIKGTTMGVSTDENGDFKLSMTVEQSKISTIVCTFIGMKTTEVKLDGRAEYNFILEEDSAVISEVVVTGYFERKKESFTGAMTSFKGEELVAVNNQNILASLSMVSPSFKMIESNTFGSDPNRIPEFQIRGGSSLSTSLESDFANSPNMPTFIMDGFEVTAQKVFDMDPNRIESMTILKDAAATAIYGSRAANGVVVIETKNPAMGKMKVSYTMNLDFDAADLSDYNLMNAAEKLEYENLARLYSHSTVYVDDRYKQAYNDRLKLVSMGVDTDWLAKPVRQLGVGNKHSILLEGGDRTLKYGVNLNYSGNTGVMKGSGRERIGINVKLQYNYKNLKFINTLSYDNVEQTNSPYGSFSQYTYLNPYFYPYDSNGNINEILFVFSDGKKEVNPLFNTTLNSKDNSSYNNFTNNFSLEWQIADGLKFSTRLALVKQNGGSDIFKPAEHTDFINSTIKGRYTKTSNEDFSYDANAVLSYSKIFGRHLINGAGVFNVYEGKSDSYTVVGQNYPNSRMDHIGMGTQYLDGGRPTGNYSITRLLGLVANANYSYDNRYLADLSLRGDASSLFGSNNRWGLFFAGGLGWNLHNEGFLKKSSWINLLKVRGSWGETGGIKFNPYQWMMMLSYNDSDIYGITYNNKIGALLIALGNPNLQWQKKEKINLGLDFELFSRKVIGNINLYRETSKNQLVDVTLAPSVGFPTYMENLGKVRNSGIELSLRGSILKNTAKAYQWDIFANIFHNKNELIEINDALTAFNEKQDELASDPLNPVNKPMVKYQEGRSMNTIWVVESMGIDPSTGQEIFINRKGEIVSLYDFRDQKPLGCTDPLLEGNFGTLFSYKGFQFSGYFSFKYGGDLYNQTLVDKVENVNPTRNADKRVLYDRWKGQGDVASFKSIADRTLTNPSSRFLEKDNELRFSSLSISYTFGKKVLNNWGVERLKLTAMTNDVLRYNSSKIERGISYPFSRYFSLAAQITF